MWGGSVQNFVERDHLGEQYCRLESDVKVALNCISFQGKGV